MELFLAAFRQVGAAAHEVKPPLPVVNMNINSGKGFAPPEASPLRFFLGLRYGNGVFVAWIEG